MAKIHYVPIGIIHSPFTEIKGMPIQPSGAAGVKGTVEMKPEFVEGLKDLDGFSHIILIYHFHQSKGYALHVIPFLDTVSHGVFATRAPKRPNPVGLSVVRLIGIDGGIIHIEDVDIVDNTPLLDIKPYVPAFDAPAVDVQRTGWLSQAHKRLGHTKSDARFR
ncbi:MAG: tRNA (N6-threonylcarbamoyladenosine(37)-N6)-methyltransferase TrmO [bacterium]